MPDISFIAPQKSTQFSFRVEPAYNTMCSVCLLSSHMDDLPDNILNIKKDLSEKIIQRNSRYCKAAALLDNKSWESFPAWVDHISQLEGEYVKEKFMTELLYEGKDMLPDEKRKLIPATWEELSEKKDVYVSLVKAIIEMHSKDFDQSETQLAWELMQNPGDYLELVTSHFRFMWDTYLEEEWERTYPLIKDSVNAFETLPLEGSVSENMLKIIERENIPAGFETWLNSVKEIIYIPSPHIGPYLMEINRSDTAVRIVGNAKIPAGSSFQSPALSRSELLMRLSALADPTRMRILELAKGGKEISTQLCMDKLGLSQSSASRHLNHLSATGYFRIQQRERTKFFTLKTKRIENTFTALMDFLE